MSTAHSTVETRDEDAVKGSISIHSLKDVETTDDEAEALAFERRTMRHIDWRMLPLLGMLYAFALIDRSNLGVARIAGMGKALGLSVGSRYSIVSCLYFVPYILLQLPSNMILRQVGPRNLLAFCVIAWGAVQVAMGFVTSWGYLVLCRALLGALEAGFFPAVVWIIQSWYIRHEVQKRLAAFYLISILAGGFSAIFAYALTLLDGRQGIAGWSWIFIVEGAITMGLGVLTYFFVPDFPDKNKFLDPKQTALVLDRVENDRGDSVPDQMTFRKLLAHLSDWKIWAYGVMFMCATMPAYAIAFFVTLILAGMGWDIKGSLLLSAPPYVFAAISIMFFAWISDKYCKRAVFIAIQAIITLIGLVITGYAPVPGWRYFGVFLSNAGSAGCIPGILAYASNNVVTDTKRSVSTAIIIMFGGIGGIFATTVFRQADAPRYIPGIWATIACQLLMLALLALMTLHFWRKNKQARQGTLAQPLEGRQNFFYTL